jgi:SM-20-related protein
MQLQQIPVTESGEASKYEALALDLYNKGWSIVPDFLPAVVVHQLRCELIQQWQAGKFRTAAIGRGADREINTSIRNDEVKWLEDEKGTASQQLYFQAMNQLRMTLNRKLFLGLVEFEAHFARYEAGAYYQRHLDQFRGLGLREVTVILYLNGQWIAENGGELLLYQDMETTEALTRIYPHGGQLVAFLSSEFPHEVMPATQQRMSITGWFKKSEIPLRPSR